MISEEFRQKFKTDLGIKHYAFKVQKILKKKRIYTNRGKVASKRTIQNVFGGHQEDEAIELVFNELYELELSKKKTLQNLREQHIKPLKTKS